jgi:regulator of cell morphogenesis and NO signaling
MAKRCSAIDNHFSTNKIYNMSTDQLRILNVYELAPQQKHATVFHWFHELGPGQSFTIRNDHDPKPLYYQMLAQLGPVFSWEYTEQGPEWWQVILKKNKTDEPTIGEIAAKDLRKADAMKKMGIDFCCGGKKTIGGQGLRGPSRLPRSTTSMPRAANA